MELALNKSTTAILALDFVNDIVHPEGKFAARGVPAIVAEAGTIASTKRLFKLTPRVFAWIRKNIDVYQMSYYYSRLISYVTYWSV